MDIVEAGPEDHGAVIGTVVRRLPHIDRPTLEDVVRSTFLDADRALLVAREGGEVVGVGIAGHPAPAPQQWRTIRVTVAEAHEGRGVGRRLHDELRSRLPRTGVVLRSQGFDGDPRSRSITEHWGFTLADEHAASRFDLTGPLETPGLPDGVTFEETTTLDFADRNDVESMLERSQTNPEREHLLLTLDALLGWALGRGVGVVVRVDGRPAAITWAGLDGAAAHVVYTGVDPALRGRDLAALAKQQLHVALRREGLTSCVTENETGNLGIRRLNARLGYVVEYSWYAWFQEL